MKSFSNFYILFLMLFLAQCQGDGQCGPLMSPQVDADSDCVEDASDNCPFLYNPSQVDVDDNSLGDACQTTPIEVAAFQTTQNLNNNDCEFSLMDCEGTIIELDAEELTQNTDSDCSAMNPTAVTPPELWCLQNDQESRQIGPVTLNPEFLDAISPCDVFADSLDLSEWCE